MNIVDYVDFAWLVVYSHPVGISVYDSYTPVKYLGKMFCRGAHWGRYGRDLPFLCMMAEPSFLDSSTICVLMQLKLVFMCNFNDTTRTLIHHIIFQVGLVFRDSPRDSP